LDVSAWRLTICCSFTIPYIWSNTFKSICMNQVVSHESKFMRMNCWLHFMVKEENTRWDSVCLVLMHAEFAIVNIALIASPTESSFCMRSHGSSSICETSRLCIDIFENHSHRIAHKYFFWCPFLQNAFMNGWIQDLIFQ